jgi:hypothetical protein
MILNPDTTSIVVGGGGGGQGSLDTAGDGACVYVRACVCACETMIV